MSKEDKLESDAAQQINNLHHKMVRTTAEKAFEIGSLLTLQKAKVGHGNWQVWVEENLDFSIATAKRYMRVFAYMKEDPYMDLSKLKLGEIYQNYKDPSKTQKESKDRTAYLKKQDQERKRRREAFANREHKYINPPEGEYTNQIICGQFEQIMPEMIINGFKGVFDAIITSWPFNGGQVFGNSYNDSKKYCDYLKMVRLFIQHSYELLRKGGRLIVDLDEISRRGLPGNRHNMLEVDIFKIIQELGIEFFEMEKIVWYKEHSGSEWIPAGGTKNSPERPRFKNKYETILVLCKETDLLENINNVKPDLTESEYKYWARNHWDICPITHVTPHPAAYTEELCARLIKLFTWPGGLVGDFFCGSGTTCKVSADLGRKFVGVDQNPNYCQYSRDRIDMDSKALKAKYAEFIGGKLSKSKLFSESTGKTIQMAKLPENKVFENKSA